MAIALLVPKGKQISENANSKVDFSFPECLFYLSTHFVFGILSLGFYDHLCPSVFSFHCWVLSGSCRPLLFLVTSLFPEITFTPFLNRCPKGLLRKNNFCCINKWWEIHIHMFFSFSPSMPCPIVWKLSSTVIN